VSHHWLLRFNLVTQLTLRGFDAELEKRLRELAARDQLSLNKAALKLMRRGAGLEATPSHHPRIGNRLRRFGGVLDNDDARLIDKAVDDSRKQDMELQE